MTIAAMRKLLPVWIAAAAGGALFELAGLPLGWILGALTGAALWANLVGPITGGRIVRRIGQVILGCATASLLTAETLDVMALALPVMLLAALVANATALALTPGFASFARVDRLTAVLSVLPAGLAEMSGLAQSYRARSDVVAIAHTTRVALIVLAVPLILGAQERQAVDEHGTYTALGLCFCLGLGLAWGLNRRGMLNPWIVMPMLVGAALVLSGHEIAAVPAPATIVAQVMIGGALGSRLSFQDFARLPRSVLAAIFSTLLIATVTALALTPVLFWVYGLDRLTVALALVPGGLGEMVATANALEASIPVVLGFQFIRSLVTNTAAPLWIWLVSRD